MEYTRRVFLNPLVGIVTMSIGIAVVTSLQMILSVASAPELNARSNEPLLVRPGENSDPIAPMKLELSCYDPSILPIWHELKKDEAFQQSLRFTAGATNCSDILEVKRLDLNRDANDELLVRGKGDILCGGIGNCDYWVFERRDGKVGKLLAAVHEADQYELGVDEVQKSRTRNYSDILLAARDGQNVLRFLTYRFDGNEYVQAQCMAEVPKPLRDGAGSWELITCDEHERRRYAFRTSLALGTELPGCWSSGSGKYFKITEDEIFLSTNRFKPVKFAVELSSDAGVVLQLIDRPQFYFFQEFVSFELDNETESAFSLTIKDFRGRQDLESDNRSSISGWVKSSCKHLGLEE